MEVEIRFLVLKVSFCFISNFQAKDMLVEKKLISNILIYLHKCGKA